MNLSSFRLAIVFVATAAAFALVNKYALSQGGSVEICEQPLLVACPDSGAYCYLQPNGSCDGVSGRDFKEDFFSTDDDPGQILDSKQAILQQPCYRTCTCLWNSTATPQVCACDANKEFGPWVGRIVYEEKDCIEMGP